MQDNGKKRKKNGENQNFYLNMRNLRSLYLLNRSKGDHSYRKSKIFNNTTKDINSDLLNITINQKREKNVEFDNTVFINRINSDFDVINSYSMNGGETVIPLPVSKPSTESKRIRVHK